LETWYRLAADNLLELEHCVNQSTVQHLFTPCCPSTHLAALVAKLCDRF